MLMQAHIVRAMLEAICFQTRDVLEAMQAGLCRLQALPQLAAWAWGRLVTLEHERLRSRCGSQATGGG